MFADSDRKTADETASEQIMGLRPSLPSDLEYLYSLLETEFTNYPTPFTIASCPEMLVYWPVPFQCLVIEYNSIVGHLTTDISSMEGVQRRFTKRLPGFGKCTYSKRLELLNLPSLELRRLHFHLVWTYKIILGHVYMRSDDFLSRDIHRNIQGPSIQAV